MIVNLKKYLYDILCGCGLGFFCKKNVEITYQTTTTNVSSGDNIPVRYIGIIPIYKTQDDISQQMFEAFLENDKCVNDLLMAQMRSGKTGTIISFIDKVMRHCNENGLSCIFPVLICMTQTAPQEQWMKQLYCAFIDNNFDDWRDVNLDKQILAHELSKKGMYVLKISDFNKQYRSRELYNEVNKVDVCVCVADEIHWCLHKTAGLPKLLKQLGIMYGKSCKLWEKKNISMISVSATPFTQLIKMKWDIESFTQCWYFKPGSSYLSLKQIRDNGRFIIKENILDDEGHLTDWSRTIMQMIIQGGNKYALFRQLSNKELNKLKEVYGDQVCFKSCDSSSDADYAINQLNVELSVKPLKPTILHLKNALSASEDIKTTSNICFWMESGTEIDATFFQRLRMTGFNQRDDKFFIACTERQLKAIEVYIKCIEDIENNRSYDRVPSATFNKSSVQQRGAICHGYDIVEKNEWNEMSNNERSEYMNNLIPDHLKDAVSNEWSFTNQTADNHHAECLGKFVLDTINNPSSSPKKMPKDAYVEGENMVYDLGTKRSQFEMINKPLDNTKNIYKGPYKKFKQAYTGENPMYAYKQLRMHEVETFYEELYNIDPSLVDGNHLVIFYPQDMNKDIHDIHPALINKNVTESMKL